MQGHPVIVPFPADAKEAARFIDAEARPVASVLEPPGVTDPSRFRDAVVDVALEHEGGPIAGVLFTARWGGGGVVLT